MTRHENLVVCGPSGTGKIHFLEALYQAAVDAGHKATWFSLEHLGGLIRCHGRRHRRAGHQRIMRAEVILIEVGPNQTVVLTSSPVVDSSSLQRRRSGTPTRPPSGMLGYLGFVRRVARHLR